MGIDEPQGLNFEQSPTFEGDGKLFGVDFMVLLSFDTSEVVGILFDSLSLTDNRKISLLYKVPVRRP